MLPEILRQGVEAWNHWRSLDPEYPVGLSGEVLKRRDLQGVNLSRAYLGRTNLREANLQEASFRRSNLNWADLQGADLRRADLHGADLRFANLRGANLAEANLQQANLKELNLQEVNLYGADLREAHLGNAFLSDLNLRDADMREAYLQDANLSFARLQGTRLQGAYLHGVNLHGAYLQQADLTGANLGAARLQDARLTEAVLTGAILWETQRSGWSIKRVICEYAYWDVLGQEETRYAPGEFEKLYKEQARVELVYPGGISVFEVNTLPALLQHLAEQYPDTGVRLKSIEETGGGVRVSIHVEEADAQALESIREEAKRAQGAQIALRDRPAERLEIEKQMMLSNMLPRMLAAAGQKAADRANTIVAKESGEGA
ncbi:MAG TPA: pentapeptide repeat-containing protein [Granulicella sp.]